MNLHIAPNRLISDVQKDFNDCYPFLKLEFFSGSRNGRPYSPSRKIIPGNRKIGDAQLSVTDGNIDVTGNMKVSELETLFHDGFSLSVQVFRRSGNLWLETTMTDNWTLEHQNAHGREITQGRTETPAPEDYDLNRDADH